MPARVRQAGAKVQILNDLDRVVAVFDSSPAGDAVTRVAIAADYTAQGNEDLVAVTSTGANRAVTLPAASSVLPGRHVLTVKDEGGGAATNNITVNRAGADTVDGATSKVINTNYGFARFYSDGVSKWFSC